MTNKQKKYYARFEEATARFKQAVERLLTEDEAFTGKVVFTVNCKQGGIGNTEAHIQKKIET